MASVIASVVSINILPYILVAVKSNFLKFDVSNIYKIIFTSLENQLPLGKGVTSFAKEVMFLVVLVICLFVCLLVDVTQNVMNGLPLKFLVGSWVVQ